MKTHRPQRIVVRINETGQEGTVSSVHRHDDGTTVYAVWVDDDKGARDLFLSRDGFEVWDEGDGWSQYGI